MVWHCVPPSRPQESFAGTPLTEQIAPDQLSLSHPAYLDDAAPPPPPKPLMGLLEQVGVGKSLEAANINLYGFVEGGYSITTNPARGSRFIPGNVFNIEAESRRARSG